MKNKTIAAILTASLLTAALSGCGAGSDTTSSAASSAASGAADAASEAAATTEVTEVLCSTNGAPNPFTYVDEDGNIVGYDIELVEAAFDLLPQYDLQIEVVSDALAEVDSGRAQLSANNWGYKDERAEKYIYSDASFQNNYVVAVPVDNTDITQFSDLQGKSTPAGTGSNYTIAEENYNATLSEDEEPINLIYEDSDLLLQLQNVEGGKYDFLIIDEQMFNQYVEEYGLNLKGVELSDEDMALIGTPYSYIIFEKSDAGRELQIAFNEALAEILTNGTADAISDKYFSGDYAPEPGVKAPSEQ